MSQDSPYMHAPNLTIDPYRLPLRHRSDLCQQISRALMCTRFFRNVSTELLDAVLPEGYIVKLAAGETLIEMHHSINDAMYFLLGGVLDVKVGDKYILSLTEVGEAVGEIAAITDVPRTADVIVREDCTLVEITKENIQTFRAQNPARYTQFLELITGYLGGKIALTTDRVRSYEDLVLESNQLRSYSSDMERQIRHKLEQILLYSRVVESSQDGIIIGGPLGAIRSINDRARTMIPWNEPREVLSSIFDLFPDLKAKACSPDGKYRPCTIDTTISVSNHSTITVELSFFPVFEEKKPIGMAVFMRDISEHKQLLASLERSREELAHHSKNLEVTVLERTKALRESNQELSLANEKLTSETAEKTEALAKLGEAQAQLLESEKMVAIGHLAAGVAHEINNPIGFIGSNLGTIREYFDEYETLTQLYEEMEQRFENGGDTDDQLLQRIKQQKKAMDLEFLNEDTPGLISDAMEGASRIATIVRNLKEFTHLDQDHKKPANLNDGIENTLQVIGMDVKKQTRVQKEYGDIPDIECYPKQLNQVFLNILLNAFQAIESDGLVIVRTFMADEHIVINIEDNGAGIEADLLAHIFDPFFTTRSVGSGTGLGMSVVYNIVKRHRGIIDVDSAIGKGTKVTLRFPLRDADETLVQEAT